MKKLINTMSKKDNFTGMCMIIDHTYTIDIDTKGQLKEVLAWYYGKKVDINIDTVEGQYHVRKFDFTETGEIVLFLDEVTVKEQKIGKYVS